MESLLVIINNICRYGLQLVIDVPDRQADLEKNLVLLYAQFFALPDAFDEQDYPDFDTAQLPNLRASVGDNFPDFGFYSTVLNPLQVDMEAPPGVGDAVDDLADIVQDLLEVKWRYAHNSEADAIWYFKFQFRAHTQDHLLGLLQFMKEGY